MHPSRFATWLLVVATASSSSFGDQNSNEGTSMQPQQILNDCVQAVQAGDFQRYVGHLSEQELLLQAGFVLFITSTMSRQPEHYEPEVFLLTRALKDLVEQHSVPESQQTPEQQAAEEARQKLPEQLFQAALGHPTASGDAREACIDAAKILTDPERFLVAVLTETARPTHTSEGERQESKSSVDIGDMAKVYGQIKWTVYTRGGYALALASAPDADTQGGQKVRTADAVNANPALLADSPSVGSSTASIRILFRKIEAEWKIDGLLPINALTPTDSTRLPQANVVPPHVYSPEPGRVRRPVAQPTSAAPDSR